MRNRQRTLIRKKPQASMPGTLRGFSLVMVLGISAVIAILSLAFATQSSRSVPVAVNRAALERARQLAASGVAIAARYLMYPPASVADCDYWRGTSGLPLSIDGKPDTCIISVSKSATDRRLFTVSSIGQAIDSDGVMRARRTVTADLIVPPPDKWCIPYAFLAPKSQTFPSGVKFYGDLHVKGNITSSAWCQDTVSATGSIVWGVGSLYGPPGAIQPNQFPQRVPPVNHDAYMQYPLDGTTYNATQWSSGTLRSTDWVTRGGIVTPTNPGGVLMSIPSGSPKLKLKSDLDFTGTIVINGDVELDGSNVKLSAMPGFPALVVTGDIALASANRSITINGPVIVGKVLMKGSLIGTMRINGPVIVHDKIETLLVGSVLDITWTAGRSVFHNFAGATDRQPYTILRWQEN